MSRVFVNLQFACKNNRNLPRKRQFQAWLNSILPRPQRELEVTIRLVDKEESRKLNLIYRGKNNPTNVLSFSFKTPLNIKTSLLGDLVICKGIVEQEAAKEKSPEIHHWAHVVIHGYLHLLGYDHLESESAKEMESIEKRTMLSLGYTDPLF